jgi:hypothetical protein
LSEVDTEHCAPVPVPGVSEHGTVAGNTKSVVVPGSKSASTETRLNLSVSRISIAACSSPV